MFSHSTNSRKLGPYLEGSSGLSAASLNLNLLTYKVALVDSKECVSVCVCGGGK